MRRAAVFFSGLLDCVKSAQSGITGSSKNHIRAFVDLRQRNFFKAALKPVNQPDVHPADKTESAGLRGHSGDEAHQIRTLMFLENQRSDVGFRRLAVGFENHAIDDRKLEIRIIVRYRLHDWALSKAYPDDQIVTALSKRAHRRLDRNRIAGFDVAQDYVQLRFATARFAVRKHAGFGAFHARPGRRVERTIVFAANIKNNPNVNLRFIVGAVQRAIARRTDEHERGEDEQD